MVFIMSVFRVRSCSHIMLLGSGFSRRLTKCSLDIVYIIIPSPHMRNLYSSSLNHRSGKVFMIRCPPGLVVLTSSLLGPYL